MSLVELRAESIVHGGEALARHEGRVVFVRGAAPGDLVEAEITGEGRFEHVRALRVLQPGAARVDAPCVHVGKCGGCPIQHVSYEAQLAAKEALTADALQRIGGFEPDSYELARIVSSPKQFQYRRRARMHRTKFGDTHLIWGFAQAGESYVEPIDTCLLFEPALQELVCDVPGATELGLLVGASGKGALDVRGSVKKPEALLSKRVRGVVANGTVYGDPVIADELRPGLRLRARPDTFAQANRGMVPALQQAALEAVGSDSRDVLELFCGSGTLTLPLIDRGVRVTGVESVGPSLQLLRKSADEARLNVRLIAGDAAKVAASYSDPVDCVLLDPPRTGAAGAVKALIALRARRVAYVSCDAPTLARDGKLLREAGYRLVKAVPLDLFPQTSHYEVVATFVRA